MPSCERRAYTTPGGGDELMPLEQQTLFDEGGERGFLVRTRGKLPRLA